MGTEFAKMAISAIEPPKKLNPTFDDHDLGSRNANDFSNSRAKMGRYFEPAEIV